MATVTQPTKIGKDRWIQIPMTWKGYLALLKARGERPFPHYVFVDGRLTIVSPSQTHESYKKRLGWMIEEILLTLEIPFSPSGSTTLLKSIKPRTGIEPDECYYLTNIKRIRGKKDLVMGEDPPPDLAVELVISRPVKDALSAYQILGVKEVWVCAQSKLVILVLTKKGTYRSSKKSRLLPFLSAKELTPWVYRDDLNEMVARRNFRAWVADELLPRVSPERGTEA